MLSCLSLLDAIFELHVMHEKMVSACLIGNCKWIIHVINAYLIQAHSFMYNFCSLLNFLYIGGLIS
jgi:hypothetical protein